MLKKASPVDMRTSLVIADALKKAGTLFIPMPVLGLGDYERLLEDFRHRMVVIEKEVESNA